MAPVIKELKRRSDVFITRICVTAQHRQMLDQVLELFDIQPDYDLNIMENGQDLFDITSNVMTGLKSVFKTERPDIVLVHGDTTTTMAASLASYYFKSKLGHIEAGLRTGNKFAPFPEEINRKITGSLADVHFAPTQLAKQNLLGEGVPAASIFVTGNTVIDALYSVLEMINNDLKLRKMLDQQFEFLDKKKRLILVTGHRRENFGNGFENICKGLLRIADSNPDVEIVYPVHLNPNVQEPVQKILGKSRLENIHLIDPVDYLPFVYLMNRSYLIITDSGGIQEEAPSLGKPVLVMREITERPEALKAGTIMLVGADQKKLVAKTTKLLNNDSVYKTMSRAYNPYGDGSAAMRIVEALLQRQIKKTDK